MIFGEFAEEGRNPRRGMTSIEAEGFLRRVLPEVDRWMCWSPAGRMAERGLCRLPVAQQEEGTCGTWVWRRIPAAYPVMAYCNQMAPAIVGERRWTGAIRVTGPGAKTGFVLFSFLNSLGTVGETYLASTLDAALLRAFGQAAVREHDAGGSGARIRVIHGEDVELDAEDGESPMLAGPLLEDIEAQTHAFFGRPALFDAYRVPRRRGLLFVGPPGNGKTMMVRRCVRDCVTRFGAQATMLRPTRLTDEDDVLLAFDAACEHGPGILILEDLDTLTKECGLTRAGFLDLLDGVRPREGLLLLATTNNPADIDPALAHRPSRFDRVWRFELPDARLRRQYLAGAFPGLAVAALDEAAGHTGGWSFAYLNELRVTAAILAMGAGAAGVEEEHVRNGLRLLAAQFAAGKGSHARNPDSGVGFTMAG